MIEQADIGRQLEKIRTVGTVTEHLDGRPTTRYTIDVGLARLIDAERDTVVQGSLRELANAASPASRTSCGWTARTCRCGSPSTSPAGPAPLTTPAGASRSRSPPRRGTR
jgi:hypothetical protein